MKKDYRVKINTGESFVLAGVTIDTDKLTKDLNIPDILFINLGGMILNKHTLMELRPLEGTVASDK